MAVTSQDMNRYATLAVGVLILLVPLLWIGWSLAAASEASQAIRVQSETLALLRQRLSALSGAGAGEGGASVYLPGATAPIAGAAMQRIVTDTVEEAGGRLAESEILPVDDAQPDPGRVNLRVSFEADIVGLQNVLFKLETGMPILVLDGLSVETNDAFGSASTDRPILRVVARIAGHWEVRQ